LPNGAQQCAANRADSQEVELGFCEATGVREADRVRLGAGDRTRKALDGLGHAILAFAAGGETVPPGIAAGPLLAGS
jgi:hypothetical protein